MSAQVSRPVALLVLATAALLAGCVSDTSRWYVEVEHEARETARSDLDEAGQANCVLEALVNADTLACPRVETGGAYPRMGTRLLDGFVTFAAGPTSVKGGLADVQGSFAGGPVPGHLASDQARGANAHRASGGVVPEVVWPGPMKIQAAYGFWDDDNTDGLVAINLTPQAEYLSPDNEWFGLVKRDVHVFIEPGSHPPYRSMVRPESTQPDMRLESQTRGLYDTGLVYVIFTDGSLFQTYRITTIAEALLQPSEDGRFPYSLRPTSLADVDRYAAVAPGPVEPLYLAIAGGVVNAIGSPSYGLCPAGCSGLPLAPTGTAADPALASTQDGLYAKYPREWLEGSGSTSAGRLDAHRAGYAGWIDLLARTRVKPFLYHVNLPSELPPFTTDAPLIGRNTVEGEQAAAPGFIAFDLWMGLWKDLNEDGYVGVADPENPYEGGARPLPDDYFSRNGEFYGTVANVSEFTVWLVPDEEWGPGGARLAKSAGLAPETKVYEGRAPVPLVLFADDPRVAAGHYASRHSVFIPDGSPGFTVCTPPLEVRYAEGGLEVVEILRDCDHVARWS